MRMGRPNKFFPFKVAAFSHASGLQNSTYPLPEEEEQQQRQQRR